MLYAIFSKILGLVYPEKTKCLCCGEVSQDVVCEHCKQSIQTIEGVNCNICGRELPYIVEENICEYCKNHRHYFDKAIAPILYEGSGKELIHKYKYNNEKELIPFLAKLMINIYIKYDEKVEVITYVPLHEQKEKERGYNQSKLLAEYIGEQLGIEVLPLLNRVRYTIPQFSLKLKEREMNVLNAFKVIDNMNYKNILLIDDIYTSGSTVDECAKKLKERKAEKIIVLTVANGVVK